MRNAWINKLVGLSIPVLVSILVLAGCARQSETKKPEEPTVKINRLDPERGPRGSTLVISGSGFSETPSDLVVSFGQTRANIKNSDYKMIVVEVPKTIVEGKYDVAVTNNNLKSASAPRSFTVIEGTEMVEREQPAVGQGLVDDRARAGTGRSAVEGREPARESSAPYASSAGSVVVPAGTTLVVRSIDAISTKRNRPGDRVEFSLDEPLVVQGLLAAPKGSRVTGRITQSKEPGRIKGRAQLSLTLVELVPSGGRPHAITTNAYSSQGPGSKKRDAMIIGGAAGVGAAIGAIAGGKKGAAIGAGVGGGSGTAAVVAMKGKQLEIPPETKFRFRLRSPVTLPARGHARSQPEEPR